MRSDVLFWAVCAMISHRPANFLIQVNAKPTATELQIRHIGDVVLSRFGGAAPLRRAS
jgi:hypothetical protein